MSAYNLRHNLAFIHIPKNAGTSIRQTLNFESFDKIDEKHRTERDPALANHFPVYRIQKLLRETESDIPFDDMIKVMVVRNPWERMVSLYRHRLKKLHHSYEGKPRNRPMDIDAAERGFNYWLLNTPHEGDAVLTTMAQSEWGRDEDGDFIIDVVFKIEELEDEWPNFCRKHGFDKKLPKTNIGDGQSKIYREHYSDEAASHVATYFAEDIVRYNYGF